ncbi:MAG: helix-turn-helix transcriptional regulator [Afipia sp.]|nr:helix-turn-helix transcriptional regulator [Afipia sp.]
MGQELIAAGDTLYSAGGRLSARNPRVEKSIRNFFSSFRKLTAISNNDRLLLSVTDRNESVYVSHLLPLKLNLEYAFDDIGTPAADLFIRRAKLEMSLNVDVLSDAFRLTPAEVRVLTSIVNIGGTPEAAAAMGIAVTTVKTHLGRLFEKTGTTRQADLVKLVAACTMPLVE